MEGAGGRGQNSYRLAADGTGRAGPQHPARAPCSPRCRNKGVILEGFWGKSPLPEWGKHVRVPIPYFNLGFNFRSCDFPYKAGFCPSRCRAASGRGSWGWGWRRWLELMVLEKNSNDLGQWTPFSTQIRRIWGSGGNIQQQPLFLDVHLYSIFQKRDLSQQTGLGSSHQPWFVYFLRGVVSDRVCV